MTTITAENIFRCETENEVKNLIEKAAGETEYLGLVGEGFDYHSFSEHVVIARAYCLEEMAKLFQAAVEAIERFNR